MGVDLPVPLFEAMKKPSFDRWAFFSRAQTWGENMQSTVSSQKEQEHQNIKDLTQLFLSEGHSITKIATHKRGQAVFSDRALSGRQREILATLKK